MRYKQPIHLLDKREKAIDCGMNVVLQLWMSSLLNHNIHVTASLECSCNFNINFGVKQQFLDHHNQLAERSVFKR